MPPSGRTVSRLQHVRDIPPPFRQMVELDYRKINFNKQHITSLRLIFSSTASPYTEGSWIIQICRKQIYFGSLLEQLKTYRRWRYGVWRRVLQPTTVRPSNVAF